MNAQHVAFVTAVDAKHVERANGQSFDLWQVHDSDNNTWVVKKPLADFARSLVGQQAQFSTRSEQKPRNDGDGFFTNYYADQIIPMASVVTSAQAYPPSPNFPPSSQQPQPQYLPAQQAQQQQPAQYQEGWGYNQPQQTAPQYVPQPQPQPAPSQAQEAPFYPSMKDLSIYRQVAAKVAGDICKGDQYVFWTLLPDLMQFFVTGSRPASIVQAEELARNTVNAARPEPQAYAEGASLDADPGPEPGAGGGDPYGDDIPFIPTV
jgi:hypothetical protein